MQNNSTNDPSRDATNPQPGDAFPTAGSASNANASSGSGSSPVPVAAVQTRAQGPAPPAAAGLPHAMVPNTLLVPARWPTLLMESLAPAAPRTHYNHTATTPAAYGSLPNAYANRGRFVSVADVRAFAAQKLARVLAPNPGEAAAAAAARGPGTPAKVPSPTSTQISTAAGPSPASAHARRDAAAVGSGQAPVGPWQASVLKDDSASDADDRTMMRVESDYATIAIDDDEELSSEDESEEYEVEDEEDEEGDEDDGEEEDDGQREEEDDEEEVPHRFRVTGDLHRWLGCARRD